MDAITQSKEAYLRDFSEKVFGVAEGEYQAGKATKNTARSFLHASVFFEALRQFGPLSEDVNGRIRYSKWKATEIMTAISEGRAPVPAGLSEKQLEEEMNGTTPSDVPDGPSFGQMSYAAAPAVSSPPVRPAAAPTTSAPKLSDSGDLDLPDVPVFSQSQLSSQRAAQAPYTPPITYQPPPSASQSAPSQSQQLVSKPQDPVPMRTTTSSGFNNFISSKVVIPPKAASPASIDVILEATKFSKNAISALQFDDPETAIKNLRAALRVLTGQDH